MEEFEKKDPKKVSFGKKVEKFAKMVLIAIIKQVFSVLITLILIVGFISFMFSYFSDSMAKSGVRSGDKKYISDYNVNTPKTLLLEFSGGISDNHSSVIDFFGEMSNRKLSLYEVITAIDLAREDKSVDKIYINIDTCFVSFEHMEEIINEIKKFKESGKKVYAYGHYLTLRNYYLASIADEIYMEPAASTFVNITGYHAIFPYYKKLTDKLGITYNVIHIGDYKSFGENMSREDMSDQFKSEIEKIYNGIYGNIFAQINENRKFDDKYFENEVVLGNLAAKNSKIALEKQIIDGLKRVDEFKKDVLNESKIVSISDYLRQDYVNVKYNKKSLNNIAVIYLNGAIYMDSYGDNNQGDQIITPKVIEEKLNKALNDYTVKGIVLRINSPGGSALASEIIYNKVKEAATQKPIYVSMGNIAASGGYYISSAVEKVYANNTTITGSIGVVSMFPDIKTLSEKIGINFESISYGKYSGLYDMTKSATDEEIELIRVSMEEVYQEFKLRVSQGRNIDINELEKIAQGRVWTGEEAKNIGLVDELGGLDKAVSDLAVANNIKNYKIKNIDKKPDFMDYINMFKQGIVMTDILDSEQNAYEFLNNYIERKTFGKKAALYFPYDYIIEGN